MASSVSINLYDLSQGMAKNMSRSFLGKQIDGIWHTGIVVYGKEFYYGGGICQDPPAKTPYGSPMKNIPMGETEIPQELFLDFLKEINSQFTAEKYDLFMNNCNNFTDTCCEFLVGEKIPNYITGLPKEVLNTPMGKMLKPMIDNMQKNMVQNSHPIFDSPSQGGGFGAPNHHGGMNPNNFNHVPQYNQAPSGNAVLSITAPDEFMKAIKESPAVIVDFFSYTCPPCMKIKPFFERLAQTFQARCPGLKFVSVDTQIGRQIATSYQISSIPTFIGFLQGSQFQKFSGADTNKLEGLAYSLEGKINGGNKGNGGMTSNVVEPSFKLLNPKNKDFYTFAGANYANPIKNINGVLEGFSVLNEPDAKEIFVRFAQNPQENAKSFNNEEKTYLINWILESMFFIEISDKTLGFLDLLRMLSLDQSYLEIIFKNEDKLHQIIKFFEKPEQALKDLPKGLKLVLLRLITNLSASTKSTVFFQNNLNSFVELMVRVGNIYREDKPSIFPIMMTLWNLVQNLHNTKEFSGVQNTVVHFARLVFNDSNDNEVLLASTLILAWLSYHSKEAKKEVGDKINKAKLAKLEFSEDETVAKITRDLSDIVQGEELL